MEASCKAVVHVLLLALLLQAASGQHWSYGWLPGGKRSVGELEATIRMMGTGGVVSLPEEASAQTHERRRPYNVVGLAPCSTEQRLHCLAHCCPVPSYPVFYSLFPFLSRCGTTLPVCIYSTLDNIQLLALTP
ncbi:gonadotropin-releasing hormone 3 isoform X2 [Vanacampus margaritifer]